MSSISELIRNERVKKNISQKQLANMIGTTQSAIARLEGGKHDPSMITLKKVAEALKLKINLIIGVNNVKQ